MGSRGLAALVSLSAAVNLTKSSLGEGWVYLAYRLESVIKGGQGRNFRQKKPHRALKLGREAVSWLASSPPPTLLSCLSYTAWGHLPRDGAAHGGLTPPYSNEP